MMVFYPVIVDLDHDALKFHHVILKGIDVVTLMVVVVVFVVLFATRVINSVPEVMIWAHFAGQSRA